MNILNGNGKRIRILVSFILIRLKSGEIVLICIYIMCCILYYHFVYGVLSHYVDMVLIVYGVMY
jgi:hypothetical protein